MRIAYLDCIGGISGDMFVGALLDAGWPEASFREAVSWLSGEIAGLHVERREHYSLAGLGIRVELSGGGARGLTEVLEVLARSPLAPRVRDMAARVFRRLAEAEARAHGKSLEEVHFHEVGAVDALVDVVSTCQGVVDLDIEELYVSSVPVGQGTIEAAHGMIPLPAPATAHLLKNVPIKWVAAEGERTTPTGAALVTSLGRWDAIPAMHLESVGTGAGSRSLPDIPNLARLFIGQRVQGGAEHGGLPMPGSGWDLPAWGWGGAPSEDRSQEASQREGVFSQAGLCAAVSGVWRRVAVLSVQVDDATPEEIAGWVRRLEQGGALDVTLAPVTMKKARPGALLTVICRPEVEPDLVDLLLNESSTLGVRRHMEWRRELEREVRLVETRFGQVIVKMALRGDRQVGKPEFESCREVAEASGVAFREVWRAAVSALEDEEATTSPPEGK